jgi:hypothetical protein
MTRRNAVFSALVLLVATQVVWGEVPRIMSYQGVLKDAGGDLVADGSYSLTFKLYDGSDTELWSETQPSVQVGKGVFSVILGNTTPLNLPFDEPYFLGITVGAGAEMVPRIPLTASPYSLSTIGGASSQSACRAYRPGDQGLSPNTWTKIQFDVESYDLKNEFDSDTNYSFTAQKAGIYSVSAKYTLTSHVYDVPIGIGIFRNGSMYSVDYDGDSISISITDDVQLNAGDTIDIRAMQHTSSSRTIQGTAHITTLAIHQIQ